MRNLRGKLKMEIRATPYFSEVFPQISLLPFSIIHPFIQQVGTELKNTLYIHFLTSYSFFNPSGVAPMPTTLLKLSRHHHPQLPCCQTQWSLFRPHPSWESTAPQRADNTLPLRFQRLLGFYNTTLLSFSSSSFSNQLLSIGPKCFLYRVFLVSPVSMVFPATQWKWKC